MSDPREGAAAAEHEGLHAAEEKMREAGVAEVAIATFAEQYGQLLGGERSCPTASSSRRATLRRSSTWTTRADPPTRSTRPR